MSFVITTDSGADLPMSLLREHDIHPLIMEYEINGELFPDTMQWESLHEFYDKMRAGATPRTTQINIEKFKDFFRPFVQEGKPVVHISLGSGVSGTMHNGILAAEELKEEFPDSEIHIVDSTLCSTGYGMLALKADEMRAAGKTAQECVDWLNAHKIEINTWYTTNELKYLHRSGRCSHASAIIGTALRICPILNLDAEGHLIVQERVRGLKSTLARIHKIIGETLDGSPTPASEQTLYICHSDIPEEARAFGEALQAEFGFKDIYYTYIGSIIGSNCGPGLMAAFYFGKPRDMRDHNKEK